MKETDRVIKRIMVFAVVYIAFLAFILVSALQAKATERAWVVLRDTTVHLEAGSGSIVQGKSGRKFILTNYHVCIYTRYFGKLHASFEDGRSLEGKIVAEEAVADLCLAEVPAYTGPAIRPAESVSKRERFYTRGYPEHILSESQGEYLGEVSYETEFSVAEVGACPPGYRKKYAPSGVVYACGVTFQNTLTTLYSAPGSSGSPVVNGNGQLVGIIQSQANVADRRSAGLVPFPYVSKLLSEY